MRRPLRRGQAGVNEQVARLLSKFEYPDQEGSGLGLPQAAGGNAPSVVVGASDASEFSKARVDIQCYGSDDHVLVQQAFDLMQHTGGRVLFTEGTFNVDCGYMTIPDDVKLEGMNTSDGTIFSATGGTGPVFEVADDVSVEWLTVQEDAALTSVTAFAGSGSNNARFSNIGVVGMDVGFEVGGDDWQFDRVYANQLPTFISATAGHDYLTLSRCKTAGLIDVSDMRFVQILGSRLSSLIELGAAKVVLIDGNVVVSPGGAGTAILSGDGGNLLAFTDSNIIGGFGYNAVELANWTDGYIGGQWSDITQGVYLDGCVDVETGGTIGARPVSGSQYLGQHGVSLNDCTRCDVYAKIIDPGGDAANTYDAVHLSGSSDRCRISTRVVVLTSGQPRYGVNDTTTGCNRVVDNDLGPVADYGTDALNTGANTVIDWPNDPTYGDNFTDCASSPSSP